MMGPGAGMGGPMMGGAPGAPAPGGGDAKPSSDAMIELKVDPDKLPKAEVLRSRMFLSTSAIAVTDQDIRLTTRQAFITPANLFIGSIGAAALMPAIQAARDAARAKQAEQAAANPSPTQAAPPQSQGPSAGGPPGGRPGGPGGPGRPGGRRGRPPG